MRIVGIETSSRRGSVALVEGGRLVAARQHETPGAHGEHLLAWVSSLVADAGWARTAIDRVAVGTGPGSFTGLRVGIAFAQGMGLGLGLPVVGVGSLLAMARAVPAENRGARCPLLDARRDELFLAVYGEDARELVAPRTVPRQRLEAEVAGLCPGPVVLLGEAAGELGGDLPVYRSEETDLPAAAWVARAGEEAPDEVTDALYVRPADATVPRMPPSPLLSEPG